MLKKKVIRSWGIWFKVLVNKVENKEGTNCGIIAHSGRDHKKQGQRGHK